MFWISIYIFIYICIFTPKIGGFCIYFRIYLAICGIPLNIAGTAGISRGLRFVRLEIYKNLLMLLLKLLIFIFLIHFFLLNYFVFIFLFIAQLVLYNR